MCIYTQVSTSTFISLLFQLRSRSNDTPEAAGTPCTQIFVSNAISCKKQAGLLGEMCNFKD